MAFEFIGSTPDLFQLDIEGRRVRLVSINETYTQEIFTEFSSNITTYMFPKPAESVEETEAFIRSSLTAFECADDLQLVVLDKATGEFLGCCGLHGSSDPKTPELGIWLKRSAHGQALGKEAVCTLAHWAQNRLRISAFVYPVDKRNQASIPVSLGGQIVEECVVTGLAGNILDEVVYRIPLPLPPL